MATASQVIGEKDNKMESKGTNRSVDIRIKNFDVSFVDNVLLRNADLLLAVGRRYRFVDRNGLEKTTLLKMISGKQLQIPSDISIRKGHLGTGGRHDSNGTAAKEKGTKRPDQCQIHRTEPRTVGINMQRQNIEADKAPARASIILNGFTNEMQAGATRTFSGG